MPETHPQSNKMENKQLPTFMFRKHSVKILVELANNGHKPTYGLKIAKNLHVTYGYFCTLMRRFEKCDIIVMETNTKDKRKKYISLTSKGRIIANKLLLIMEALEQK